MFNIGDNVQINKKNIDLGLNIQLISNDILEDSIGQIIDLVNDNGQEKYFLVRFNNTKKNHSVDFKLYESEIKLTNKKIENLFKVSVSNGVDAVLLSFEDGSTRKIDVSENTTESYIPSVGDIVMQENSQKMTGVVVEVSMEDKKCKVAYAKAVYAFECFSDIVFKKSAFDE